MCRPLDCKIAFQKHVTNLVSIKKIPKPRGMKHKRMKFTTSFWAIAIIMKFAKLNIRIFPRKGISCAGENTCMSFKFQP